MDKLYIVVPCYNEEEVLPETSKRLKEKMGCLDTFAMHLVDKALSISFGLLNNYAIKEAT